jgi:hypothetical protein
LAMALRHMRPSSTGRVGVRVIVHHTSPGGALMVPSSH